jgi:uncharacterized protein
MQPSMFNLRVPIKGRDEVFLMNTLTDAQLVVSSDVAELLDRAANGNAEPKSADEAEAFGVLRENGFLVRDRAADREALDRFFDSVHNDRSELHVTVLTTLQCNFACDYCWQGDHGDYNKHAEKMSMDTAARVGDWVEREMDSVRPEKVVLVFFGGEPLLNLPVVYYLSERLYGAAAARALPFEIQIITNGLLLTSEVVDRLVPLGLFGVKITLDGDRDTHNRMRPLRGQQGTFDRIIANVRQIAGKCKISIGGNFDETSADSFTTLLDFLSAQEFADKLYNVRFKPVVRYAGPTEVSPKGVLPLIPVGADNKPLNGTCMSNVGSGGGSTCDSCSFLDEKMDWLRTETRRRGFQSPDGVHMGPCHVHRKHAQTIGPDGSLYACPGFTGELALSTGHIDGRRETKRETAREQFERLHPWKECGDCAFIPTCAGGCITASHTQLGDMNLPTCHKPGFESALLSLAYESAGVLTQERLQ